MQIPRKSALLPGLVAITASVLAVQPAAAQQTYLNLYSGDVVTVSGAGTVGSVSGLPVANSTNFYYTGENPPGYDIGTYGNAAFTLTDGGTLGVSSVGLDAFGSGPVAVTGGTIDVQNGSYGVFSRGAGGVTVSGGTVSARYPLYATQGTIFLTGGSLHATSGNGLSVGGGTIDVFGTGFSYTPLNGTPRAITSGTLTGTYGTITGTLLNGQTLSTTYSVASGSIQVNVGPAPAPESSQTATLGLGVLGLAGLTLKARRRNSIA